MKNKNQHSRSVQCLAIFVFGLICFFSFLLPRSLKAFTVISNAGKPAIWENQSNIPYKFVGIPDEFQAPLHAAFQAWVDVPGVTLGFNFSGEGGGAQARDGMNSISWVTESWTSLSFRPPSRALAVTLSSFSSSSGVIVDADIYFNAETFQWAVVDSAEELSFVDVQNIATHEVGHLLGLDHSSTNFGESNQKLYEATMFYASGSGETSRRTPKEDDENGILNLYAATPIGVPSIQSVEVVSTGSSSVTYQIKGSNFSERTSFLLSTGSNSVLDSVSRYREMLSSSEYEVTFSTRGFPSGMATMVAFNDPSDLATFRLEVEGDESFRAASSGGGGCSIQGSKSLNPLSSSLFLLSIFVCLGLVKIRQKSFHS